MDRMIMQTICIIFNQEAATRTRMCVKMRPNRES
jgi:hypothetical protein